MHATHTRTCTQHTCKQVHAHTHTHACNTHTHVSRCMPTHIQMNTHTLMYQYTQWCTPPPPPPHPFLVNQEGKTGHPARFPLPTHPHPLPPSAHLPQQYSRAVLVSRQGNGGLFWMRKNQLFSGDSYLISRRKLRVNCLNCTVVQSWSQEKEMADCLELEQISHFPGIHAWFLTGS